MGLVLRMMLQMDFINETLIDLKLAIDCIERKKVQYVHLSAQYAWPEIFKRHDWA